MTRSHRSTTQANSSLAIFSAILLGILVLATPALAVISQSATTTTLVASPSSVTAGSVVTLTATVASGGTPLTAGQVVFCNASAPSCEDSATLGTAWVTISGTATIRRALPSGTTNITASYRATKLYLSSQSSQAAVTVTGQQQVASTANTHHNTSPTHAFNPRQMTELLTSPTPLQIFKPSVRSRHRPRCAKVPVAVLKLLSLESPWAQSALPWVA